MPMGVWVCDERVGRGDIVWFCVCHELGACDADFLTAADVGGVVEERE